MTCRAVRQTGRPAVAWCRPLPGRTGNRPPISWNLSITANPSLVTPDLFAIIFQPASTSVPHRRPPDRGGEGRERDQDVGEHVAGEQDATVREQDRGVRLMLDDLARHGPAVRGQRVTSPGSPRGMPGALSAAFLCPRSRASPAARAPAGVA